MSEIRSELDETLSQYSSEDFEAAFRELPSESGFEPLE
jgi:hypothetical protein